MCESECYANMSGELANENGLRTMVMQITDRLEN